MKKSLKTIALSLGIAILVVVVVAGYFLIAKVGPIGAGYKAKMLCSYLFVSGRQIEPIMENDLEKTNKDLLEILRK